MPESASEHDAFAGLMDMRGASVRQPFMGALQEPTDEFINSLIEPQQDWSSAAHDDDDGNPSVFTAPPAPCTDFQPTPQHQQKPSPGMFIQEPCSGPLQVLPSSQLHVQSCRARRAISGELGAKTLQAAWSRKTIKHSHPLRHLEHSTILTVSSVNDPQHLDSCIAALWAGEGAGVLDAGLQGVQSLGAMSTPSRQELPSCMQQQPYDLQLDDFFPVSTFKAEPEPGEGMQDHIFSDCFRPDLAQDAPKDLHTSTAYYTLPPLLAKPQEPTSTSSDDEFCAMLFENAPSLTSSEASLAFCPSEQGDRQQRSDSGKRSSSVLEQPRSQANLSKKMCLDLGLERGQDMYSMQKGTPTADRTRISSRAPQPMQQTSAPGRKMQPGKGSCKPAVGAAVAAAAAVDASSRARGKPALKAQVHGRFGEVGRGAQAKRRLPRMQASKPHSTHQPGDEPEGPRGPSSSTPFAAVQALLEWQALSHRVVSAAASLNQAIAWSMLTDSELARFLAKMGKANIVCAGGDDLDGSRREYLIHGIKQIVGSARQDKQGGCC